MSGTVISPLKIFQEGILHLGKGKTIVFDITKGGGEG